MKLPGDSPAVVADTGPLNYLVLTGHIDLLPQMFGTVAVPAMVLRELEHPNGPEEVRGWAAAPPGWLCIHPDLDGRPAELSRLDRGELAAIMLAQVLGAGLLLMDDRAGSAAARALGFEAVGTAGLLSRAAGRQLVDLPQAVAALKATNFRYPASLFDKVLDEHRRSR